MNHAVRLWDWFLGRSFEELLAGGISLLLGVMTALVVEALR